MARAPDKRIEEAKAMYLKGMRLVEIASQLNLPEGTVRRWKSTYKWGNERSDTNSERSHKKGPPKGSKNALGNKGGSAPEQNKNAEKHGLFSKYLPEETLLIIQEMPRSPLDILWDNIQISYAAIVRSQQIMYVRDQEDKTVEKIGHKKDNTVTEERWEIQQAWDKQANFLSAQARAMKTLEGLVKQYDDLLHKNWDLASEEQKARVAQIRAQTRKLNGTENHEELQKLDDVLKEIEGVI